MLVAVVCRDVAGGADGSVSMPLGLEVARPARLGERSRCQWQSAVDLEQNKGKGPKHLCSASVCCPRPASASNTFHRRLSDAQDIFHTGALRRLRRSVVNKPSAARQTAASCRPVRSAPANSGFWCIRAAIGLCVTAADAN